MPTKRTFLKLMEDSTSYCDQYRQTNIDPAHRRADLAYHGILENEAEYIKRGRSALFIPKTRDHVRRWTTTIVNAFFASDDIATLTYPPAPDSARFTNEVFNIRLEKSCNFYRFLVQAAHVHVKYGNAVAKTGWDYRERTRVERYTDDVDGAVYETTVSDPVVDRPFFDAVPFENIQVDFRCMGTDPVQDSPFFREWVPFYLTDVEEMFRTGEWKRPRQMDWKTVSVPSSTESVRKNRQGRMEDPQAEPGALDKAESDAESYRQIWVVVNFFRIGDTDWTFLSLGDKYIVTDPERVVDKHPHGRRPYAISQFDPEAFRVYSDGLPEMMRGLQAEVNAIRNQRRDNVSLVMNAGHYVRSGSGIDFDSLLNSRPGQVVIGDDISELAIRRMDIGDVTASAYREEQIASSDIEEISGQSRNMLGVAASDRQSATEAAINASSSGELEGFIIKGFLETLVIPMLDMFKANLIAYENDPDVLDAAAAATGLPPDPRLLVNAEITVNAGMGTINKELRSQRIGAAMDRLGQFAALDPTLMQAVREMMREWLPLIGFKNMDRFLPAAGGGAALPPGAPSPAGAQPPLPPAPPPSPAQVPVPPGAEGTPNLGGLAGGLMR